MDVLNEGAWTRPAINPSPMEREYFEAAGRGQLVVQQCTSCGHRQFPPKGLCTTCGGDPEWVEVSGQGAIHTFTVVRRHGVEPFASLAPFVLAMIDLPEGVRMMGNVTGIEPDQAEVGLEVVSYGLRIDESMAMPMWKNSRMSDTKGTPK